MFLFIYLNFCQFELYANSIIIRFYNKKQKKQSVVSSDAFSFKSNYFVTLQLYIFFYLLTNKLLNNYENNNLTILCFWVAFIFMCYNFVIGIVNNNHLFSNFSNLNIYIAWITIMFLIYNKNYITLLFILECFSAGYLLFFINLEVNNKLTNLLKKLVVLMLFNSTILIIFYVLGLIFIIISCGTLDFLELNNLPISLKFLGYTLILFSVFVKLGLPSVHFLKLEIYKYLDTSLCFFYVFFTCFFNIILLIILLQLTNLYIICSYYKLFNMLFLSISLLIIYAKKPENIFLFMAYSTLIAFFFIIIALL